MKDANTMLKRGLSAIYDFASERFRGEMVLARREFDLLVPIPPVDDEEMHDRLIMFSHWFLIDRPVMGREAAGKTPASLFYEEKLLGFSYEEEEMYRSLRAGHAGIYEVMDRHHKNIAADVMTGEELEFTMGEGMSLHANKEIMTMRFMRSRDGVFLLASYCTHPYSTKDFIRTQLEAVDRFDHAGFAARVFELTALSIKSEKYNWISPLMIYNGMSRL